VTGVLAAVPETAPERRSWTELLREAIRPQFRVDVYVAEPSDPVLFGALCAVSGCPARGAHHLKRDHYLCAAHGKQWRGDGRPDVQRWVRVGARPLQTQMLAARCQAHECPRSVFHSGLCYPHFGRWKLAGRPDHAAWAATADAVAVCQGVRCRLPGCRFPAMGKWRFCDTHNLHFAHLRASDRAATPADLLARAARRQRSSAPRYDLRALPELVRLELQFALQCRHDARGARLEPVAFRHATRWVAELDVASLLERSGRFFEHAARERFASTRARGRGCPELAWVRYARARLQDLRDRHSGIDAWEWDTWTVEQIGVDARYAHQPQRRIYFADIEPAWLRELAKRWARWRITSVSLSPEAAAGTTNALRAFCRWLAAEHALPATPRELTRGLLERYLAHVHARELSTGQKQRLLGNLRTFLDDVRRHEWAPGLPGNATYFDGEIPRRSTRRLPRFIDEFVMGQIEHPGNLGRLPDHTTQTAIVILIETGLRSIDALRLPFDPVTVDAAGAPYLVYTNHKLAREAVIPISQRLLEQIRRQQADVARRYASEQRHYLLPRVRSNPDGRLAFSWATLRCRLARWLADCEIRDASGRPAHVTPHQFRHTLATRLVNNEVPLDTVRRLLDHNSPEMTARYAQIKDQTLRREWERYQQRINVRGEVVPLDPDGPLSDAAWALENLARAKQTLPNGSCGLPLQQTCPHPNACLTCDHFLTTPEFLAVHGEQLGRTRELLATARERGQQRLIDMNEPIELNLVRIIDGLQRLTSEQPADAA
jgi:integrase